MAKFQSQGGARKGIGTEIRQALMTGVSYMLPLVIAGAVIMGTARIGASFYGVADIWDARFVDSPNALLRLFHAFDMIGGLGLFLMLPVAAGYIAYGIASKPGLAPGLIAGLLAQNLGTGFLGVLVAGLFAGYLVRFLATRIRLPGAFASVVPIFIIPFAGTLITCVFVLYVIGDPLAALNQGLESWLRSMSGTNKVVLAAIVGGMTGFDLGGPVNKAAVTTSMALLTSGIYDPNTAAQVAIIVPPLGLGLAALLWPQRFPPSLHEAGKASLVMGFVGVSEGALPFVLARPRLVLVNVAGTAFAAALAVSLGAVNQAPISGFYGWLAVHNWAAYVLSIAAGALIVAAGSLAMMRPERAD